MQAPLDRANRRRELVAHFDQRLALDVERDQRAAIELGQPVQPLVKLVDPLACQQRCQRALARAAADAFQCVRLDGQRRGIAARCD